jgi:hypothetical protein
MRSLTDGWEVRNGQTDQRFITAAELKDPATAAKVVSAGFGAYFGSGGSSIGAGLPGGSGGAGAIVEGVIQSVLDSQAWKDLGERIVLITRENNVSLRRIDELQARYQNAWNEINGVKVQVEGNWAAWLDEKELLVSANEALASHVETLAVEVGNNTALIQDSNTAQANWNTSYAQSLTQLQASVNGVSAAIQQEAEVRAEADGKVMAKVGVKLDVNNRFGGWEIIGTGQVIQGVWRTDTFAVGAPSGTNIPAVVPFTVLTTTDANGNPPGVYMTNVVIQNAAIGSLKIAGEAVSTTFFKFFNDPYQIAPGGTGTFYSSEGTLVGVVAIPYKKGISQVTTLIWSGRTGMASGDAYGSDRRFGIFGDCNSQGVGGDLVSDYGRSPFIAEAFTLTATHTVNNPSADGIAYCAFRAKANYSGSYSGVGVTSRLQMITLRR